MKSVKVLIYLTAGLLSFAAKAQIPTGTSEKVYGIHLFFNEKEFVDVLTLYRGADGQIRGRMLVPNDFEGEIVNLFVSQSRMAVPSGISFDLYVPKNQSRPQSMIFHYVASYYGHSPDVLSGFVSDKTTGRLIAAFVGFVRKPSERTGGNGIR